MSSLLDLDINPRILSAINKARLNSFEKILSLSTPDIERAAGLSQNDVQGLKTIVAEAVHKQPSFTALQILKGESSEFLAVRKLTTGCEVLDKLLRGGLISRGITEISGESASGKTQLCLQLSLTVQLPNQHGGLNSGAAYICTEDAFPNKRLQQMMKYFSAKRGHLLKKPLGDGIFIEHVADVPGLVECVVKKLPLLLSKGLIGLVVIDSVAAVFRSEYESKEMIQRAKHLSSFASSLHSLGSKHNIPIICVNQVSASMKSEGRKVSPALGLTWANQLTTRIMLSRTDQQLHLQPQTENGLPIGDFKTTLREMEVVFSPHVPPWCHPYFIDQSGVKAYVSEN